MPVSSDPVLLRVHVSHLILLSLKRLKLTMKYFVSFDGHDIDDFRQKSVFSCPNTFIKISSHTKILKCIDRYHCINEDGRPELVPKRFSFGLNMAFINQQKFWMMSNAKSSSESIVDYTESFAYDRSTTPKFLVKIFLCLDLDIC